MLNHGYPTYFEMALQDRMTCFRQFAIDFVSLYLFIFNYIILNLSSYCIKSSHGIWDWRGRWKHISPMRKRSLQHSTHWVKQNWIKERYRSWFTWLFGRTWRCMGGNRKHNSSKTNSGKGRSNRGRKIMYVHNLGFTKLPSRKLHLVNSTIFH